MIIDKSGSISFSLNPEMAKARENMEKLVAEMAKQKCKATDEFLHGCLLRMYPRFVANWVNIDAALVFPHVRQLFDATGVKYHVDNKTREEVHQVFLGETEVGILRVIYKAGTLHKLEGYAEKITRFRVHNRHVRIFVWNCTKLLGEIGNRANFLYPQLFGVTPEATVEEIPHSVASIIIKDREGGE